MKKKQSGLAYDEEKIASISKRIIDKATQPNALAEYFLNYSEDEAGEEMDALRSAINSDYQDFRQRFVQGERGDVETELNVIREQALFHIGVAVGLRLR